MDDNAALLQKGVWFADSREQNVRLKEASNGVRFLGHRGDGGENWSYDLLVITKGGQTLKGERKTTRDAISSMDKLERQTSYVDFLVVEWNLAPLKLTEDWEDPKFRLLVENVEKRMWRLAFRQPVIFTHDVEGTIRFMQYLAGKRDPIDVRAATVVACTCTLAAPNIIRVNPLCQQHGIKSNGDD